MTPSFSGSEAAFFEIAATLIPLFLLAGVVVDRVRPKAVEPRLRVLAVAGLLPAIGAWAIFAEVVAIGALVSGSATVLERSVVASALMAAMLGVVISLWLPWLARAQAVHAESAQSWRRSGTAVFTSIFVGLTVLLVFATDQQGNEQRQTELASEIESNQDDLRAVEDRAYEVSVQLAQSQRGFFAAMTHHGNCLIEFGYLQEEEKLRLFLNRLRHNEYRLTLRGANLVAEFEGRSQIDHLPVRTFPEIKDPPRITLDAKGCRREFQRRSARKHSRFSVKD